MTQNLTTTELIRDLRRIARTLRGEAMLKEPGWPLRVERLAEALATTADHLHEVVVQPSTTGATP